MSTPLFERVLDVVRRPLRNSAFSVQAKDSHLLDFLAGEWHQGDRYLHSLSIISQEHCGCGNTVDPPPLLYSLRACDPETEVVYWLSTFPLFKFIMCGSE